MKEFRQICESIDEQLNANITQIRLKQQNY